MVTVVAITAVLAALIVYIQLLIAVVIVLVAAAGAVLIIRCGIRTVSAFGLISASVFPSSAHALISSH